MKTLLEYPNLNIPPLNPYKPEGALNWITIRTLESTLGISFDGCASKISIYGIDKMEFQEIEHAHFNYNFIVSMPTLTFCSDDVIAKIKFLTLPVKSANFFMNATASKHLQANTFTQINDVFKFVGLILVEFFIFKPF